MASSKQYTAAESAERDEAGLGGPGLPNIGRIMVRGATDAQKDECRALFEARIAILREWGATPLWVVNALHRARKPWRPGLSLRPADAARMSDDELLGIREIGVKALSYIRAAATP